MSSNVGKNLKNYIHYLAITTKICKANVDPPVPRVDDVWNDVADIDDALEKELEKSMTSYKLT